MTRRQEPSTRARYEEIAIDLARRIASGELAVGTRLSGRSLLAATYGVSAETIRRGVALLHARGVLEAVAGSGIRVLSRERAVDFLEQKRLGASVIDSERELRDLLRRRAQLDHQINEALRRVMQQTQRLLALAGDIGEVRLTDTAAAAGQTLAELGLRAKTGATALVIVRGDVEHFSPPADFRLQAGDTVLLTGEEPARQRARELLETGELPAPAEPAVAVPAAPAVPAPATSADPALLTPPTSPGQADLSPAAVNPAPSAEADSMRPESPGVRDVRRRDEGLA